MKRWAICLALLAGAAWGHEVHLDVARQEAAVVRLSYADGQPFAFEAYELYLPGKDVPEQVGRTNRLGQVIFLPGTHADWRLKAYSGDGHGLDQSLKVKTGAAAAVAVRPDAGEPPRALLLAAGLGVLFGIFGVFQLFMRRKT